MSEDILPEHSPLGASGMYRWSKCAASSTLASGISEPSSTFAAEGTNAHALAEFCLYKGQDAWELIGSRGSAYAAITFDVTPEMADAVQVYIDDLRTRYPARNQGNSFIERSFHCPTVHPMFYGTADFVYIDEEAREVHVHDYKHGAGIVVEVPHNPQLMYYGVGVLEELQLWDKIDTVTLHVAQPRGWHIDGPLRHWSVSTEDLAVWVRDDLVPAMVNALVSTETTSGTHCRFCPARSRACPQLVADMLELETLMAKTLEKGGAKELSNLQIGRFLTLYETAKMIAKEAEKTAFSRLQAGKKIPGRKLASKRSNRKWKDDAEADLKAQFGEEAYTPPTLKSPAQIDALPQGGEATARWSFKPETGLTVVSDSDTRAAVSKDTKSLFTNQTKRKST
jgi:hypothetical protein|tara:strand:- start:7216 stop:8403 length:1188 start_codon:yes stop_codon:yes gene_type:complete